MGVGAACGAGTIGRSPHFLPLDNHVRVEPGETVPTGGGGGAPPTFDLILSMQRPLTLAPAGV